MEKINFRDYPNTTTPIDSDNLNLMQNNIENWLVGKRIPNVDLNNYKSTGVYYFTTGCTNAPATYLYCLVIGNGSNLAMQIGMSIDGQSTLYIRKLNDTTWSEWKEL